MKIQSHYLTTRELLFRKFIDYVLFRNNKPKDLAVHIETPGYTLLKDLSALSDDKSSMIGIYTHNETKKKVFIKKYIFDHKGLRYASLMNELAIMELLNGIHTISLERYTFIIPECQKVITADNQITIICEYIEGKKLITYNNKTKIEVLKKILTSLYIINDAIIAQIPKLPHRYTTVMALTFPYFWLKTCLKDVSKMKRNIAFLKEFYVNFFQTRSEKNVYGLIHRDLHSRNLLLNNTNIIITDWEGAVVTDVLYDLAMISRLYNEELDSKSMMELLSDQLHTAGEKKRYIYLTLFYCIQTLGVDNVNDKSYKDTEKFLEEFPKITKKLFTD